MPITCGFCWRAAVGVCHRCGKHFCESHKETDELCKKCAEDRRLWEEKRRQEDRKYESFWEAMRRAQAKNNEDLCGWGPCSQKPAFKCTICRQYYCGRHITGGVEYETWREPNLSSDYGYGGGRDGFVSIQKDHGLVCDACMRWRRVNQRPNSMRQL